MIRAVLERPLAVAVGTAILVALGLVSLARLPISLLPALERPRLEGSVELPGHSRDEVLRRVTRPLERELMAVPGVLRVETETADEALGFRVQTEWETDPDGFRVEIERRLANATDEGRLRLEMAAGDHEPVVEVAVLGGAAGRRAAFVERVLRPELARLSGAGRVEILGATPRHVVVTPRWADLAARGLSVRDLTDRLERLGTAVSLGRARLGGEVRPLVLREEVASLGELGRLGIPGPGGEAMLADVAELGIEEVPGRDVYRHSGRDGVLVRLFRAPGGNAVALAGEARMVVNRLAAAPGGGREILVVRDGSREVVAALGELAMAAGAGFLLGTFFLRWMLGRWRPTLALAIVIPVSVIGSFPAFFAFGLAIDLVALAGLALAAGLLVDNSIVVLESIERSREEGSPDPVVRGASRVALPVVAGVVTTAIVFLPLIYLRGLARAFFGVQAFAIVAALLVSLLVSFTVTPALAGRRARTAGEGRRPGIGAHRALLERMLDRPRLTALVALAVAVGGLVLLVGRPRELLPREPVTALEVTYRLPPHRSPEAARRLAGSWVDQVTSAMAASLGEGYVSEWRQEPEEGSGFGPEATDGRLVLRFESAEAARRAEPILSSAARDTADLRTVVQPRRGALLQAVDSLTTGVTVEALAETPEAAGALAERADVLLASRGGVVERDPGTRDVPAWWARPRLGGSGWPSFDDDVRAALSSREVGRVAWAGIEPAILLDPEVVDPARIPLRGGVPLAARAQLEPGARTGALTRVDGRPAERFRVDPPPGLDPLDLVGLLDGVSGAPGEVLRPGGEAFELARSFRQLGGTLALSGLLVLLAVAALFESFRTSWIVLATVPVALAGSGAALVATGGSLDLMSFLGLVVLVGIVVNNSIVLLHRAEEEARCGASRRSAVLLAATERYRPILLSTLTTISGLLPLALLGGEGVALRRALAVTIVGGLVTGLVSSLLVIPVLYRGLGSGSEEEG